MTKLHQIYKCQICGNIVELVHSGAGELVCCGQPMQLQAPNTVDASKEKHVPVVTKANGKILVQAGSVAHPMESAHWIEWIEAIIDGKVCRKYLQPGIEPRAEFCGAEHSTLIVRVYCNLHGLWQAEGYGI